jgi:hypothetical protein
MLFARAISYGAGAKKAAKERPVPVKAEKTPAGPRTAIVPQNLVTLRIDLRSKGKPGAREATDWDGKLTVNRGQVREVRAWQSDPRDSFEGTTWKIATRRSIPWNSQQRQRGHEAMPLSDAALVVELTDTVPETELRFETLQGNFQFTLSEVPFGKAKTFLNGLVRAARTANAATILSAPTEDDYPAAALGPGGKLYVAYVAFTHGKDFRARGPIEQEPKDMGYLAQPTGGDQLNLLVLDEDRWSEPMPVTGPGEDLFRPTIAVDGTGAAWVFWTAKTGGQWDLFARRYSAGNWSKPQRLTNEAGPDLFAAATTDSTGRVWVAWQAFRGIHSQILAAKQEGDTFDKPVLVAEGPRNQWAPAIAASADGRVAVAWDSYDKGDYDVCCRIWSGGQFDKPIPIAASLGAEMRPSIAFDKSGRLWIAYEQSPEKWGKDWGALEKEGVALYQGRSVAVRVWAEGRLWEPAGDPVKAFSPWIGRGQQGRSGVKLALPRIAADADGRIWLAVRSGRLGTRVPVGSAWFEHIAYYEADQWSDEIVCPQTDNILDSRPSLLVRPDGRVALVASSDGRFATSARLPQWFIKELRAKGETVQPPSLESRWPDPVNNELVMAELGPLSSRSPVKTDLVPVELEKAAPAPETKREAADIARCRAVEITVGNKKLRLVRGEFHRHTELSQDGGGDGMLMDMWRYGLDAADHDWIGNGDHDNGDGREYSWWITQKTTDLFHVPGAFAPMYTYERSCNYPDGHRNVVFAQRGVRTLPRLRGGMGTAMDDLPPEADRPNTPDTRMLYRYLAEFDGVCASHTSGTDMGTDWRDNDSKVEPIVEIYQGCRQNYEMPGAPRANTAEDSIGGWRPYGFVSLALKRGYRLGFQASSDHVSTHISYCNCWVEELTSDAILAAMKARHVYGATDNILADVRCGDYFMGDEFTLKTRPTIRVRLVGTQPFAKVHVIKDGEYVHTAEPDKQEVEFEWTDFTARDGKTSYYYVRGEQTDGELVWVSPMWITYKP